MSKKSKRRFIFPSRNREGDSRLKLVMFDDDNKAVDPIYSFDGIVKDNVPQLWEDVEKIEKFGFWNEQNGMNWLITKWQQASLNPRILRGFIADIHYPFSGSVRQHFTKSVARKEPTSFIYRLKLKMVDESYEIFSTVGVVNHSTGEVKNDKNTCLRDLQGRYNQWRSRNPKMVKNIVLAVVLGDGVTHYENPRLAPWLMDFNAHTSDFLRKGRREVIKIHDARTMANAQAVEELISNI